MNNLKNPFIGVLVLLGAVSYATDDLKGTVVVSVMVLVSVVMRFLQEYRSSKSRGHAAQHGAHDGHGEP